MCRHTSCSSCALGFVVCVFVVAVVSSPVACGSLLSVTCGCPSCHASFRAGGLEYREHRMHTWAVGRRRGAHGGGLFGGGYVSLFIPWRACGGSHGVCVHGHTSWLLGARGHFCVRFMVFHGFPVFPCGALRSGGLFPLMLSHTLTLLVSWRPRPMRAGDVSGRALLLVVVRPLCPFPRALRTSAPFRRVAAWPIVQHTCFGGRHVHVASTLCCFVVLFFLLVLRRAQVPYSYCMHFAKCFRARIVQLSRLGGSCLRCFSVSVLPFSTSPNSGVKICGGFLRSENTILQFIFAGSASFSPFLIVSLLRSRNARRVEETKNGHAQRGWDECMPPQRKTHIQEEQEVCQVPTSKSKECDNQEQARQRQCTRSPCDQTPNPHPPSHRSPTPNKWYGEKPRHRHTHTNHVRRHRRRSNADTHHRQQSAHAYVIVGTATPQ